MYSEGNIIRGRYRLEARIGEGGMATVWRASHVALHRPVALKVVHTSEENRKDIVARFLQEARVAASVRHRHVVDILDFGVAENGSPFIAMELLEGEALSGRLSRERTLDLPDVAVLFDQVLAGIAAVHDAGIVHRDLKPENVFLVRDEDGFYVKLLDFGISSGVSAPDPADTIDDDFTAVVGTPHYMAPEQARGEPGIDHRSDLYACGVMLYECLAGVPPFDAKNVADLLTAIATMPAPPLLAHRPDLPALSGFVARAMARDSRRRFQSARDMRVALRDVLGPELSARTAAYPAMVPLGSIGGNTLPVPLDAGFAHKSTALAVRRPTMRNDRPTERMTPEERTESRGRLFAFVGGLTLVFALASTSMSMSLSNDESDAFAEVPDPVFFPNVDRTAGEERPAAPERLSSAPPSGPRPIPAERRATRVTLPNTETRTVEGLEARRSERAEETAIDRDAERKAEEARLARLDDRRKLRQERREAERQAEREEERKAADDALGARSEVKRSGSAAAVVPQGGVTEESPVADERPSVEPNVESGDAQSPMREAPVAAPRHVDEASRPRVVTPPPRRPAEPRREIRRPAGPPTLLTDPGF